MEEIAALALAIHAQVLLRVEAEMRGDHLARRAEK
jgi:hypothetical protein